MTARVAALFDLVRRLMVFLLGVAVILEALHDESMPELLIGMVMVGVLPIENLLQPWWRAPHRRLRPAEAEVPEPPAP